MTKKEKAGLKSERLSKSLKAYWKKRKLKATRAEKLQAVKEILPTVEEKMKRLKSIAPGPTGRDFIDTRAYKERIDALEKANAYLRDLNDKYQEKYELLRVKYQMLQELGFSIQKISSVMTNV